MTVLRLAMPIGMSVLLAACAQPVGPTVQVLPPAGKAFAAFEADERECSMHVRGAAHVNLARIRRGVVSIRAPRAGSGYQ